MSSPVHIEPSRRLLFVDAVIPPGQSVSDVVELRSRTLKGVIMPPAWGGGNLTFLAARAKDGTFLNLYDDTGSEATLVAATDRYIMLSAHQLATLGGLAEEVPAVDFLKVRSGTSAAPVVQAAERRITLVLGASTK